MYPEATGGYGSTRRGLASKENLIYLVDRYIASRPARPHDQTHQYCLSALIRLVTSDLPRRWREKLRRIFLCRLSVNDLANEYVQTLRVDIVPIEEWRRQPYVGEEQKIHGVVKHAGLFLGPSAPEMSESEWGGSYPKGDRLSSDQGACRGRMQCGRSLCRTIETQVEDSEWRLLRLSNEGNNENATLQRYSPKSQGIVAQGTSSWG